jgi:phosphogluconate dehydratase
MRLVRGNLGRAIVKVSAVDHAHRTITAPARVFDSQDGLLAAFKAGELVGDLVAVVRGQGPHANGMPELHKLTPTLSLLQARGQRVALLTDGRMSGASGTVLAAIHVVPEAARGGALARLRDGDMVRIDAEAGLFEALVEPSAWQARTPAVLDLGGNRSGMGRELFGLMRRDCGDAEQGASALFVEA